MKLDLIILGTVGFALAAASCSRPSPVTEEAPTEEPEPVVSAPSTPATPPPVAAAPLPPQKRLAPDGIFFLLRKKSVETDAGIVGLRPGARVIRQADGKFSVEGMVVALEPGEITNDLDLAAHVAGADARAQAAIRQTLAARPMAANPPEAASEPPSTNSRSEPVSAPPASTQRAGSSLGGTNSLGASHTRTQGGWLYQRNSAGEWEPVRRIR